MYFPEKRRLGNICFFLDDVWGAYVSGDDAEAVREQMKREILEEYEKNREPSNTSWMNLPISTSFKLKIACSMNRGSWKLCRSGTMNTK